MLIQFSVENYVSFRNAVSINMIPAKSRLMNDHIIVDELGKTVEVLPLLTIYGANASGKSNLVKALTFMKRIVTKGVGPDMLTGSVPFLLDSGTEQKPSRFEIVFKTEGIVYTYGFVVSPKKVLEEWLFAYFTTHESKIFERVTSEDGKVEVEAGKRLLTDVEKSDFVNFIAKGTRNNQLFINEAYNRDVDIVKPVIKWFKENLQIIGPDSQYTALTMRAHKDKQFISFLSNFLDIAGTGISKITCDLEPFDKSTKFLSLPEKLKKTISDDLAKREATKITVQTSGSSVTILKEADALENDAVILRLKANHIKTDGSLIAFDPEDESDGTRRLMDLAPLLSDIWGNNQVFIIDELDRSLHTHLSRLFVQMCIKAATEKKSFAQFIITTHDTNLLDRELLRKDEIAFMEKDEFGASHLTSLTDFQVSDGLNFENGYLNGRFGAIPFIGDTKRLFSEA
jgi:uncharacterized protein